MKTLTFWVWAFWMAILNHLSTKHKEQKFYAYEKNKESLEYMKKNRKNMYFFKDDLINKNIELIDEVEKILPEIDLIIIAIPNQFIKWWITEIKSYLKPWVIFLNLSKWIDNTNLKTVSDNLKEELLDFDYNYNVLSWWMIADEVFYHKELWAQIWYDDEKIWNTLKNFFENETLKIEITPDYKNIELYWAFKNILALQIWYLEWKWLEFSSIWFYFCQLLKEIEKLIIDLGGKNDFKFSQYALWWDIIATCFWKSRNRYLWNIVWKWSDIKDAIEILKQEKKHAEWYETLKWVKKFIQENNKNYSEINKLIKIFL